MAAELTQMQQAQLAAILVQDPAPFETLISHLMSSANEQRSQAESIFNLIKQTDPNSLALKLTQLLSPSRHVEARAMSAILLRKQLTRDDSYIWPRLSPATQSTIKTDLLTAIRNENSKTVRKKLCDTISVLASSIPLENEWPEISPFVFDRMASRSVRLQESAFLIFSQLAQYKGDTLVRYIERLHGVFLQGLNPPASSDVRIAALRAVINFILCLNSASDRDRFRDLLPAMRNTLIDALDGAQEATAQEALKLLIELAGTVPWLLRRQLVDLVEFMLHIAEAEGLEEGTRRLAIEFTITLAEASNRAPWMMTEVPRFISGLFAILMKMLLDVEDDSARHTAEDAREDARHTAEAESEDAREDARETSNYSFGLECLDRLLIALGENAIVPHALRVFRADLAASDWKIRHAALIALAQIAQGYSQVALAQIALRNSEVMIENLFGVMVHILHPCQDPHPRVRWATFNAIRQLSTYLSPELQSLFHEHVEFKLTKAMGGLNSPRLQACAASAFQVWCQSLGRPFAC